MEPTLSSGDLVLGFRTVQLEQGNVAACYYEDELILRRVVARSGDCLEVNSAGKLTVEGKVIRGFDPQRAVLGAQGIMYPFQIPEGSYLLGSDSGKGELILITKDDISAKILFRFWPLQLPW